MNKFTNEEPQQGISIEVVEKDSIYHYLDKLIEERNKGNGEMVYQLALLKAEQLILNGEMGVNTPENEVIAIAQAFVDLANQQGEK